MTDYYCIVVIVLWPNPNNIYAYTVQAVMMEASSPAKAILFGEHAVVYGEPAIAVALDRRLSIRVRSSDTCRVDGGSLSMRRHRYLRWALNNLWNGEPLEIRTRSQIPGASGLGSSAALSSSIAAILRSLRGEWKPRDVATDAFEIEYNVQGGASPTDTSCSVHGGGILVSFRKESEHLWSISKGERTWHVHNLDPPEMTLVVGFTGRPSLTGRQVAKVRSFHERSGFARETIREIGDLVMEGVDALKDGDMVRIGALMNRNHSLLSILGVNSKELQSLVDAALPYSYGAKLTGAGGGGSMIALTDKPEKVASLLKARGGKPYIVRVSMVGCEVHGT